MKNKTTGLFIVGNVLTILIVIQVIMYGGLFKRIKYDASMINELGKIRGQVQRVVKLELAYEAYNKNREVVDDLIDSYLNNSLIMDTNHMELVNNIYKIQKRWEELKFTLDQYHQEPTKGKRDILVSESEEIWTISNDASYRAQKITESKASYFKFFTFSFSLNVIAIIITLFIFKKRIYDDLKVSAIHDPLTRAFNRRYFNEYIEHEISRGKRKDKVFCLIMLDIDFFKNVNDTYGHVKGDYVLKEVVTVVQKSIRNYDVLARIGGEEFVILLPDTKVDSAYGLAERIRKDIEKHIFQGIPSVTISLGVVELKEEDDSNSILERADVAMYSAKKAGRNRTEIR